jgi:hypothetical protein
MYLSFSQTHSLSLTLTLNHTHAHTTHYALHTTHSHALTQMHACDPPGERVVDDDFFLAARHRGPAGLPRLHVVSRRKEIYKRRCHRGSRSRHHGVSLKTTPTSPAPLFFVSPNLAAHCRGACYFVSTSQALPRGADNDPRLFTTRSDDREEAPGPVREEFFREYRALLAEDEPWKEEVFMLEVMPKIAARNCAHGPALSSCQQGKPRARIGWDPSR